MDYYYDDDDDDDDDDYYLPFQIPWWATPPMAVPRMVSPRGVVPPWKRTPPPIRLWGESNRDTVFEHDLVKDIQTVCAHFVWGGGSTGYIVIQRVYMYGQPVHRDMKPSNENASKRENYA